VVESTKNQIMDNVGLSREMINKLNKETGK
jgi:hypothetical protein